MTSIWTVPVSGTQSRPAGLPLFVLGRNNLNPRVSIDDEGVTVRVVLTTRLSFGRIKGAEIHAGIRSAYVVLTAGGWDYLLHFRDEDALGEFLRRLDAGGVKLGPRAGERVLS